MISEPTSQPPSEPTSQPAFGFVVSLLENVGHHDQKVRSSTDKSLLDLMSTRPDNAVQIFLHLSEEKNLQLHLRHLCLILLSQLVQRLHPDFCRWEGLSSHTQHYMTEFAFKQTCESKENVMRKASVSGGCTNNA